MNKVISFLLTISILSSCSDDDSNTPDVDLIGNWKLIETLIDIGDGNGDFQTIDSEKTIEFNSDGTVSSNGSLCQMSSQSNTPSTSTYSLENSTINCTDIGSFDINFEIKGSTLIISYLCFEPCRFKFIKI